MNIQEIANQIKKRGGKLYLVGGALRDELLKIPFKDEDYCVVGLSQDEFMTLFPQAKIRGKSFAVFELENKEFALARKERKIGKRHRDFRIETGKTISIEEDLARRDVTINAMARDVLTGEFIDPFEGKKDLKTKQLRATTKAFQEDPLRVYRVARLAATLEFSVEPKTIKQMKAAKSELEFLSKERVFQEFKKALQSEKPSIFFEVLKQAEILNTHFLEINNLRGVLQPIQYHPEGDAYNHTMQVVDQICLYTKKIEIRFAALVHDLGKGLTPKELYPHHPGHDKMGVNLVLELSNRLGVPNKWKKCGITAAKEHMIAGNFFEMTPAKQVTFIERLEKTNLGIEGIQLIVNADKIDRENTYKKQKQFAPIAEQCIQTINGKLIQEKYQQIEGINVKRRLHEERVNWMKLQSKKYSENVE